MDPSQGGDAAQLTGMGGPDDEGAPSPTNSGIPLVEGGNPAWNSFLQHVPEEKRPEVVPLLQDWDKNYQSVAQEYAPWKDIAKSADPSKVELALNVVNAIESNPQWVYETMKQHLGIEDSGAGSMEEEQEAPEPQDSGSGINPQEIGTLKEQVNRMAQIMLGQHEEQQQASAAAEADRMVQQELEDLKKEVGEFPEREVVMRMVHGDMNAKEAYEDYQSLISEARKHRPAPWVLGASGQVPKQTADPSKLSDREARDLIAQTLSHYNMERKA